MNVCMAACMYVLVLRNSEFGGVFEKCMHFQVEVMMHKAKEAAMDCQNATARDVETAYRLSHLTRVCVVLYCIVLYCIVLYCIVLYCIVIYCIRTVQMCVGVGKYA
jgi:hypothetical protein